MRVGPPALNPASYAILACISERGPSTPYELAKALNEAVGPLWDFPHSQLYGVPERLARLGLVEESREPAGRRRRVFSLTDSGREALKAWLNDPGDPPPLPRDPALLKLVFSGAVRGAPTLETLCRSQETGARDLLEELQSLQERLSERSEGAPLNDALRLASRYVEQAAQFWGEMRTERAKGASRRKRSPSSSSSSRSAAGGA